MKQINKFLSYTISLLIVFATGGISAYLNSNKEQYQDFVQPALAPPAWMFSVVWSFIYIFMAIGIAYIYTNFKNSSKKSLCLYTIQLIMNFLWSFIFFHFQERFLALIWIIVLIIVVYLMIREFSKLSATMGFLQFPYLIWLVFAAYLNLMIWILNG